MIEKIGFIRLMETEHIEECPVCGGKKFSRKFTCEDYFVSHEKFTVYCCDVCQFTFTQDVPSGEAMARYYETADYVSHSDTRKGLINSVYHQVRKKMVRRKAKLVGKKQPAGRLLDMGCGTGYFAGAMKQKGWDVIGIEPAEQAAEIARNKFGLEVKPSSALFVLQEKQFNAITLWHVLEHLADLNKYMDRFSRLLEDDGTLIIAVPNVNSYDAGKYGKYWAAYDVPRHIWHFSADTFRILAEKYGFRISEIRAMPFDAFYISMLSEKYKKNKFPGIRGFLTGFTAYLICLTNKKKSSSLIYILDKIKSD